jgi:hypothetical protein
MIIAFVIFSVMLGMLMSFWWSSNGLSNAIIKTVFSVYTLTGILLLFTLLVPIINNGTVRLI